jgi:dihydrofolate reductase
MAKLIYSAIASVDGYVADEEGSFEWAVPDEEVHTFVNDLLRPVGTHLYGRRLYEVMVAWEDPAMAVGQPRHIVEFAELWRNADKVVYSGALEAPSSAKTRLERRFDPEAVRRWKATAGADLLIGGPTLAAQAFREGLVDDVHLILAPIAVGGGTPALPRGVRLPLELADERGFANGMVHLQYRVPARG